MPFDESIASEVLGKCGRVCCICRRFRPTRLQVHHIEEESKGGSNTIENAIAICLTCHTDVHSKIPFTRRFTKAELQFRRDETCRLVSDGKLIPGEEATAFSRLETSGLETPKFYGSTGMQKEAIEILIACSESKDGDVIFRRSMRNCNIVTGELRKEMASDRERAAYQAAIEQLALNDLIEQTSWWDQGGLWKITNKGYLTADELSALLVSS